MPKTRENTPSAHCEGGKSIHDRITDVINAETHDFAELMRIAGLDPTKELQWANLADVSFGTEDVTGWDFTGTKLTGADLSGVANIDKAIFSAKTNLTKAKLPKGVRKGDLIPKKK